MINRFDADRTLIVSTLLLLSAGLVMVYSTSFIVGMQKFGDQYFFVKKHLIYACIALGFFIIASRTPYEIYKKLAYPILILSAIGLLLLGVEGIGFEVGGAKRWLRFPGFTFQPSEPAKLAVIVFMAYSLSSRKERIKEFSTGFLPNILIPGVIVAL
ncbi:MAG: FtsW/RodA/SpoVE family cell cycle protein, partial [Deltaproteobacteria bacterium]|nr:FtsW/RodA/SpoVE family cell cycle protein [Deltaproteobacteria bacterium]